MSGVKVSFLKASRVNLTVELTLQMVMAVVEDIKPDITTSYVLTKLENEVTRAVHLMRGLEITNPCTPPEGEAV